MMKRNYLCFVVSVMLFLSMIFSSFDSIAQNRYGVPSDKSLQRDYNPMLGKIVNIAYQKAREEFSLDRPEQKILLLAVKYYPFQPKLYSKTERMKAKGCRWVWRVSFGKHYDKPRVGGGVDIIIADSPEMQIIKVWKMK